MSLPGVKEPHFGGYNASPDVRFRGKVAMVLASYAVFLHDPEIYGFINGMGSTRLPLGPASRSALVVHIFKDFSVCDRSHDSARAPIYCAI